MGMIRKYLLVFASSSLVLNIMAQNKTETDTIRRELTVENERHIKVGKENPLSFDIDITKPEVKNVSGDFDFTKSQISIDRISYIDQFPSFVSPKMIENKNRGYINVFGGLMYNLGVLAGVDAINNDNHKLSLNISSMWTNHALMQNGLSTKINDLYYRPDIRYDYRKDDSHYYAMMDFCGGSKNYYGLYFPTDSYDRLPENTPKRNFSHFTLSVGADNMRADDSRWNYLGNASLKVGNARFDKYNFQDVNSISSLGIYADGLVRYSLSNEHSFNIYPEVKNYIYKNEKTNNLFYTNVSPTYRYSSSSSDMFWTVEVGAGITLNNKSMIKGGNNMYFFPKIKGELSYSNFFAASLDVSGGDEITDMLQLESLMPYYSFVNGYWTTQNKIKAKLDLSFLITPNFRLSAHSKIAVKSDAIQFAPEPIDTKYSISNVVFSSYANDYTKYNFGVNVSYRMLNDILIKAGLDYNMFSNYKYEVSQEPKLKGMFALEYKPLESWLINLSYNFMNGIKYRDIKNIDTYNTLPLYQSLTANVNYSIFRNLTLYATFQTSLSKNTAAMFPYYPRQDNVLLLGLNFHF